MATFTFRFNEVSQQQVWFEAADKFEAEELLNKVFDDEINISDLPNVVERNRGLIEDYTVSNLEEETPPNA